MNLLAIFQPKQPQPHAVVRYVAATKREDAAAARRKVETTLQLAVYAAVTPQAKRLADTNAYFASMRQRERAKQGQA